MRAATSTFIPEDKLSRRAFALAVMEDVVLGRRTMRYGVERGSRVAAGLDATAGRSIINEKHGKIYKE